MCCRSVVAPAIRSSRVAEPGNELYGVCVMEMSWYSCCSSRCTSRRQYSGSSTLSASSVTT